jgi:hypothetical protein
MGRLACLIKDADGISLDLDYSRAWEFQKPFQHGGTCNDVKDLDVNSYRSTFSVDLEST